MTCPIRSCRKNNATLYTAAVLVSAALGGCGATPQGYLPLQTGLAWDYEVSTTTRLANSRERFSITNLGEVELNGTRYQLRRASTGTDYYLAQDASGIYRGAKRTIVEDQPRADPEPRYVIKFPLEAASEWTNISHPYVLRRVHPYGESLTRNVQFKMSYRVEATDAEVRVPAGRFSRCVKIRGEGVLTIYSDAVQGFTEIPITTEEWYAPNVGLVRLARSETLDTAVFAGGTKVFELVRFHH